MTEEHKIEQQAVLKAWVSPAVIEGSLELETEGVAAAGTDAGLS